MSVKLSIRCFLIIGINESSKSNESLCGGVLRLPVTFILLLGVLDLDILLNEGEIGKLTCI